MTFIGIDLGTSASAVAALVDGRPRVLPNQEGARTTPSIVASTPDGRFRVGQPAKRLAIVHPDRVAWDFVRLLGKPIDSSEVRNLGTLVPFAIVEGERGRAGIRFGDTVLDPLVLVVSLLAKLKAAAETALGRSVDRAVIGFPPVFDAGQRALLREAAALAGFSASRLVAATSLAGFAYERQTPDAERLAVADLGGGGFYVSILESAPAGTRVLATEWEPFVGGEDFDQLVVRGLVEELLRDEGVDASSDPLTLAHLKEAAERAKCRLSVLESVEIDVPLGASRLWRAERSRREIEALVAPQLEWLQAPSARAIRAAGLEPEDIDVVLNVGGSTRMPLVLETIRAALGREPAPLLHPQEAAALGAAHLAALEGDEAARYSDVLHHSLGVEAPPGRLAPIVTRGTSLPARCSRIFTAVESRLELKILEGDSEDARSDLFLGKLVYEVPLRRGETQVEVAVEVDADGAFRVTSLDLQNGALRQVPLHHGASPSEELRERCRSEVDRYLEGLHTSKVRPSASASRRQPRELTTAERVLAALHGDAETRRKLARDGERAVWSAVLESPKMTVEDAQVIASMDVSPDVLRELGREPAWSSRYEVARALVRNPRTPPEVSLRLVDALTGEDLDAVAADADVPSIVRDQCGVLKKMRD